MRKIFILFTGLFLMALISCLKSPEEPEIPLTGSADLVYKVDTINNYANGNIESGVLEGDQEINGLLYAGGTAVAFHESGYLKSGNLAPDQTLQVEGKDISFINEIFFHESGEVKNGKLFNADKPLRVGDEPMPIIFRADFEIFFHENGTVERGILGGLSQTIAGVGYVQGNPIRFDDQGMVVIP